MNFLIKSVGDTMIGVAKNTLEDRIQVKSDQLEKWSELNTKKLYVQNITFSKE